MNRLVYLLVAVGLFSAPVLARYAPLGAEPQADRDLICHVPPGGTPGHPSEGIVIEVAQSAVAAHYRHGDCSALVDQTTPDIPVGSPCTCFY